MKSFVAAALAFVFFVLRVPAATHFVDLNSTNPVSPYTNWVTAATNIQDAIKVATFSETVLVTNGIYQYGGDSFNGSNRVDVTSVTVQSVNGPTVTIIKGYQVPGTTNGVGATRCAFIREFGRLIGFTLTGGATASSGSGETLDGGGVLTDTSCVISNCIISGNTAAGNGGGAYVLGGTTLSNCVIAGNMVFNAGGFGGGVYSAGVGASAAALVNCVVSNNFAGTGGGTAFCNIYSSLLTGNRGGSGGAVYISTLNNCTVAGNVSGGLGAADGCTFQNSIIYYNSTGSYADCYMCRLTNCCTTLGLGTSSLPGNCISNAPGFVNAAAGDYHLNPWSLCVDAGNNAFTTNSLDLDGNPRIAGAAVDMGAFESQSTLQGTAHYVSLTSTNPTPPYTNWNTAATNIQDAVGIAQAGEFVIAGDGTYTNGGTVIFGSENNRVALTNPVTLVSAGGPQAAIISGGTQTRCIYVGTNATLMGFTLTNGHGRTTGDITNEQSGGGAWCATGGVVSNCVAVGNFASGLGGGIFGGSVWNSVLTNNNSANGCGAASANLYNCMVVSNGWQLGGNNGGGLCWGTASNCTFTANWAYFNGGGVCQSTLFNCALNTNSSTMGAGGVCLSALYHCTISGNRGSTGGSRNCTNYNCTLTGNSGANGGGADATVAYNCIFTGNSSLSGGGALNGSAYNCIFWGNTANNGGGEENCKLLNCTVVGNMATNSGGGALNGTAFPVYNSIVYYNTCLNNPASSNQSGSTLVYCCTATAEAGDSTCFTNEPLLMNWTGGDWHLQSNSPCINSGNNAVLTNGILYTVLTNDFDGNPRIVSSAVDVGAYEYQTPASILPYSWLWLYGFATDGSADFADFDGDGVSNYAEWRAKTNPTNAASVLAIQPPTMTDTNATITWQSVFGVHYYVQSTADLLAQPFQSIASNIVATSATTTYTDTNAMSGVSLFYRVGVQ